MRVFKSSQRKVARALRARARSLNPSHLRRPRVNLPDAVPAEFALYMRGAVAWHTGDTDGARAARQSVLDLPEGARRHRSAWAAYMLGRSLVDERPEEAIAFLRSVRALVEAGHPDPLGLAAASLGWEARAELQAGRTVRALELYRAQYDADEARDKGPDAAPRGMHSPLARQGELLYACHVSRTQGTTRCD